MNTGIGTDNTGSEVPTVHVPIPASASGAAVPRRATAAKRMVVVAIRCCMLCCAVTVVSSVVYASGRVSFVDGRRQSKVNQIINGGEYTRTRRGNLSRGGMR